MEDGIRHAHGSVQAQGLGPTNAHGDTHTHADAHDDPNTEADPHTHVDAGADPRTDGIEAGTLRCGRAHRGAARLSRP